MSETADANSFPTEPPEPNLAWDAGLFVAKVRENQDPPWMNGLTFPEVYLDKSRSVTVEIEGGTVEDAKFEEEPPIELKYDASVLGERIITIPGYKVIRGPGGKLMVQRCVFVGKRPIDVYVTRAEAILATLNEVQKLLDSSLKDVMELSYMLKMENRR